MPEYGYNLPMKSFSTHSWVFSIFLRIRANGDTVNVVLVTDF
jgi:hypothetical protein